MLVKIRMSGTVLALRTLLDTIRQDSLQTIEAGARNIHALIDHQAREPLPHSLPHDACLLVLSGETLFEQDGGGVRRESLDASFEFSVSGEREIVRVSRVLSAGRYGKSRQAAIEAMSAEIGKRGR